VTSQLAALEAERDSLLQADQAMVAQEAIEPTPTAAIGSQLLRLRGIGPEFASVLALEAFYRKFGNRREIAAYSGLPPSPWQSGGIDVEQSISKAGNARLRQDDDPVGLVVVATPTR
jgi:transposase